MHPFVFLNGEFLSAGEARAPVISEACFYGRGVFTTVAVSDSRSNAWEKHSRRLASDAASLGLDLYAFDESATFAALQELIDRNHVRDGRARITLFDGSPARIWTNGGDKAVGLAIVTAGSRPVAAFYRLTLSPYRVNTTSPLAGIKSCNYLEPLMAVQDAKARGFDEGIRLNERGEVTSACLANVFWVKGERLFTPSLKTGCLAGTTREFILENLECEEAEAGIEALLEADEIFLTSAGIGAVQAAEFEGRRLTLAERPITRLLPF
ncbi:MAG: aminotransferase class IV [Pyrinomonadaceae bacterium]